jgi:hypothetical protein
LKSSVPPGATSKSSNFPSASNQSFIENICDFQKHEATFSYLHIFGALNNNDSSESGTRRSTSTLRKQTAIFRILQISASTKSKLQADKKFSLRVTQLL